MKKVLICFMALTLIICKDKPKIQVQAVEDPFFKDDYPLINSRIENPFDPKSIPIVGKTKEQDILKFYDVPNLRQSFRNIQKKKIHSKFCKYDRKLRFDQLSTSPIQEEGYIGYSGKEYIYFDVYLKDGIVSCYEIEHLVMGKKGEWEKGKYDMNVENVYGKEFEEQIYTYWSQRTQKDRDKYGINPFMVNDKPWPKEGE